MKFYVTGIVQPERAGVDLPTQHVRLDPDGDFTIGSDASQLSIFMDLPGTDDRQRAHQIASQLATSFIGATGFGFGRYYSAEIIQVQDETGLAVVYGAHVDNGDRPEELGFEDPARSTIIFAAMSLSARNVYFRRAVTDYLAAIRDLVDCPFYCFRCIESLRSHFGTEKSGAWSALHSALGTDRMTIDSVIKNFADPLRHGDFTQAGTGEDQRWAMLTMTRDMLLKFLEVVGNAQQSTI